MQPVLSLWLSCHDWSWLITLPDEETGMWNRTGVVVPGLVRTVFRAVAAASQGMGVQAVTVVVAAESQDAAIRVADLCSWFPLLDP